jgi:hypothetical protein
MSLCIPVFFFGLYRVENIVYVSCHCITFSQAEFKKIYSMFCCCRYMMCTAKNKVLFLIWCHKQKFHKITNEFFDGAKNSARWIKRRNLVWAGLNHRIGGCFLPFNMNFVSVDSMGTKSRWHTVNHECCDWVNFCILRQKHQNSNIWSQNNRRIQNYYNTFLMSHTSSSQNLSQSLLFLWKPINF